MRTALIITLALLLLLVQLTGCRTSVSVPHPRIDTVRSGGYTWLNLHLETPYRSCRAVFNLGEDSISYAIAAFEAIRLEDSLRRESERLRRPKPRKLRGIRISQHLKHKSL